MYRKSCQSDATADVRQVSLRSHLSTKKIAYLAMFVAINVVIGAISPRIGNLKITLTYMICFIVGNFYGAIAGAIVGGLGDLLGCLVGGWAPNPIVLVSSVLIGVIPGLVRYVNIVRLKKAMPFFRIAISYALVFVICTLFINTYGLYVLGYAKGKTFWVYMGARAATQSPIVAINLGLTVAGYTLFEKIIKRSNLFFKQNETGNGEDTY